MQPPPPSPPARDRILGTLVVIVIRAKNLPNKARLGKQNPYCTVTYGLHKKRTNTIERGGQQPEWDAEFRFEILKDGLGGEEQLTGAGVVVNPKGGVLPAAAGSATASSGASIASKDGASPSAAAGAGAAAGTSKLDKRNSNTLVVAPVATGYPPGRKVLKLACWADDSRDPKLIGEGELDLEDTLKKGRFDDWVPLERKNRYAGEVYLELTWYSNEPRPQRTRKTSSSSSAAGAGAYGGAGSRVEDCSGSENGTEEWDGGSQVGLSIPGHQPSRASLSSIPAPTEISADYPDPDLAPLTSSMSTMSIGRPPLPQPPVARPASHATPYYQHSVPSSQSHQQLPDAATSSSAGYAGYPSYPATTYPLGAPTPSQDLQQHSGSYTRYQASEFGQYAQPQQPQMGEFKQLAHEHYAAQSRPHQAYSTPAPPPALYGYASPPPGSYTSHPPQPPMPPIPPTESAYWQGQPQHPAPPGSDVASSASYPTLPHSSSQTTIYAAPPPHSAPPSGFAPAPTFAPPPPPSLAGAYSSFAPPPSLPQPPIPPMPPQPPSFASPPPPPPSLRGDLPTPPPRPASTSYGAPPVPPLPPASAGGYYGVPPPPPPPQDPYSSYGAGAPPPSSASSASTFSPPSLPPPPVHPSVASANAGSSSRTPGPGLGRPLPGAFR
ncbi:hypothetical protein Rhopal_003372-T1 [Rhodotorula paludigena]|uniref:C2 domain-containing protein n=1 Tax=Rhodotorula paludigena TaxID=86838 RepID=A0AAV5GCS1_9BASI|nr:hypothetical protein Rhopal_003372-T1 [Rhodotorula paludigena]